MFNKFRPITYAMTQEVDNKSDRLLKEYIIKLINDCAVPEVSILKRNGSIRLCRDYIITVNKLKHMDKYQKLNINICLLLR